MDVKTIQLVTIAEASAQLRMSKQFLYALDPSTPGIIKLGRATRIDLARFVAGFTRRRADAEQPTETRGGAT